MMKKIDSRKHVKSWSKQMLKDILVSVPGVVSTRKLIKEVIDEACDVSEREARIKTVRKKRENQLENRIKEDDSKRVQKPGGKTPTETESLKKKEWNNVWQNAPRIIKK